MKADEFKRWCSANEVGVLSNLWCGKMNKEMQSCQGHCPASPCPYLIELKLLTRQSKDGKMLGAITGWFDSLISLRTFVGKNSLYLERELRGARGMSREAYEKFRRRLGEYELLN